MARRRGHDSRSATTPSTWRNTSPTRATSRSRSWPTITATSCISASATARCSAATRSCWKRRPRPRSTPSSAREIGEIATGAMRKIGYRIGRHDRVPVPGRRVLFHRDEHPPAGRASGDRDDHRHRPRARADPRRLRRAARHHAGRHHLQRPRHRVPHQRRESRDLRALARHGHANTTRRAGSASASIRRSMPAIACRRTTTAWSPS